MFNCLSILSSWLRSLLSAWAYNSNCDSLLQSPFCISNLIYSCQIRGLDVQLIGSATVYLGHNLQTDYKTME